MNNIVLIGFMGTGKTTSGRMLANKLGWKFVDVDRKIEELCGMSVSDIFAQYGEIYFREQEKMLIRKLTKCRNTVIATGGGAIMADENFTNLKKCGAIICLTAKPETIVRRLEGDRVVRPLLNCPKRLERVTQLLEARRERYKSADLCINTDLISPREVTEIIVEQLAKHIDSGVCPDEKVCVETGL